MIGTPSPRGGEAARDLEAVDVGEHHVEDDERGALLGERGDRVGAGRRPRRPRSPRSAAPSRSRRRCWARRRRRGRGPSGRLPARRSCGDCGGRSWEIAERLLGARRGAARRAGRRVWPPRRVHVRPVARALRRLRPDDAQAAGRSAIRCGRIEQLDGALVDGRLRVQALANLVLLIARRPRRLGARAPASSARARRGVLAASGPVGRGHPGHVIKHLRAAAGRRGGQLRTLRGLARATVSRRCARVSRPCLRRRGSRRSSPPALPSP